MSASIAPARSAIGSRASRSRDSARWRANTPESVLAKSLPLTRTSLESTVTDLTSSRATIRSGCSGRPPNRADAAV